MLDFNKLNDPEFRAKVRAERIAEEERVTAEQEKDAQAVSKCLEHYDSLKDKEQSFVRSCRVNISLYGSLTEKQREWLRDIAGKLT